MHQVSSESACARCRGCCVFEKRHAWFAPVVSNEEYSRLIECGLCKEEDFTLNQGKRQLKLVPYEDRLRCRFLNTDTWMCGIYHERPFDCRLYPFVLMWNREKDCPQVGFHEGECPAHEEKLPREKSRYRREVFRILDSAETCSNLQKNQVIIWDYDDEFKIVRSLAALNPNEPSAERQS